LLNVLSPAMQELPALAPTKSDNRWPPHGPNDAALAASKGATAARDTSAPASIVFNIILVVFNIILIAVFSLLPDIGPDSPVRRVQQIGGKLCRERGAALAAPQTEGH
jgi:hypothetical protein